MRVLGADRHHFLAVFHRRLHHPIQLDVGLDEFHRAVGSGRHRLRGSAGKPVNHRATSDQSEEERCVQQRQLVHIFSDAVSQRHDDRENHGRGSHHRRADQHRLGRGLERISGAVVFFQQFLGAFKVGVDFEIFLQFLLDVRNLLDQRQLVHRLRVVGYWPVGIHRDRYRAHAQEAERHQSERKHGSGDHQRTEALQAHQVADRHQCHHGQPDVIRRKISSHEARQDAQRRAAFFRRRHHFAHVP